MNIMQENNSDHIVVKDKVSLKEYLQNNKLLSVSLNTKANESNESLKSLSDLIRKNAALEPSLGIALTMHHHIVLVLAKYPEIFRNASQILKEVIQNEALVASAFAEGNAGVDVFNPSSEITITNDSFILNGQKKPCTLSSISDFYVLSTALDNKLKLINLPSKREGISVQSFWNLDVFKYCDNQAVIFENVSLQEEELSTLQDDELSLCLIYGLSLFNYFAVSAYIGIAEELMNNIPENLSNIPNIKIRLVEFTNLNTTLLSQINNICSESILTEQSLSEVLNLRYLVEQNLDNIKSFVLQNIGGINVMKNPSILKLVNHIEMLKYHPTGKFQFYKQFV
ncbi:acyl-CoA dehydrogenase [Acinetobacter sp. V117_2]|uniref:acyl-CoA dehydrogenase n=1 Tax=Acinetobacter sp. V117_2 TaxID=3072989 RepID=UPI00287D742A|nr:acyl-CoA dehydrogenase [Acinetobacter sp. V117_2]MDS7968134.1 acyl-CoA dehydrogenase [Acinetobacter sp. V117_2]